jgi:hypothetical protein
MRRRILMGVKLKAAIVLVLLVAAYITFAPRTDHVSLFVAAEDGRGETLVEQIAALLRSRGLKSSIGHAADDRGNSRVVLEAWGGNTLVWLSNVTLSGEDESGPCQRRSEAYPDPQQFEIRFRSRIRVVPNRKKLADLTSEMEDFLKKRGVPNRNVPWSCGAAAFAVKSEASRANVAANVR